MFNISKSVTVMEQKFNFFAPSAHIQLHLMFSLKILKSRNSICKVYTNQPHAYTAKIIIMFIKAC